MLPFGEDWQLIRRDGDTEFHARYILKTKDGHLIHVINRVLLHVPSPAEKANPYVRSVVDLEAPANSPYDYLNHAIFLGTLTVPHLKPGEKPYVLIGVCPILVDENGHPEPLNGDAVQEFSIARYYPVAFEKNVGGIRCSAETEAELNAAEPYIRICIDGLQEILLKDWILRQATDEMLDLSGQLHFLFNLANKVLGIQDLREYCMIVLREISQAVSAAEVPQNRPDESVFKQTHRASACTRSFFGPERIRPQHVSVPAPVARAKATSHFTKNADAHQPDSKAPELSHKHRQPISLAGMKEKTATGNTECTDF